MNISFAGTINVDSPASLRTALDSATSGDIIILASGDYGLFDIHDYNFSNYVTITSASGQEGIFASIHIERSSYIKLDKLTFIPGAREGVGIFDNSHHIQVINSTLHGFNQYDRNSPNYSQVSTLYAINTGGDVHNILIENNMASDIKSSAYLFTSITNSTIRGNRCDWVDSDCFKFSHADNILFENNFGAQNIHSSPGAHVDFVQGQGPVSNSIFRGNVAIMGSGSFQGLFFDDATFTNLIFENNLIYAAHNRGISVSGEESTGIVARFNTVLQEATSQKATFITLPSGSVKEFNIEGNNVTKDEDRFINDGIVAQWDDEDDIAHYSDYYINAMHGPYATIDDFAPVPGSLADGHYGAFERINELIDGGGTLPPSGDYGAYLLPSILLMLLD